MSSKFSGLKGIKQAEEIPEMPATQNVDVPKKLGRPPAKRSDPNFVQVSG